MVMYQANLLPVEPAYHIGTGSIPSYYTSDPALCLPNGNAAQGGSSLLDPCTHVRDLEEAPGSHLQSRTALAIAAVWKVKRWMEDFLSLSSSNSDFQVKCNKSII